MSIKFTPDQYIASNYLTPTSLGSSGVNQGPSTGSFSCWVRLDAPLQFAGGGYIPCIWGLSNFSPIGISMGANQSNSLQLSWVNAARSTNGSYNLNNMIVGFNYHVASTYINGTQNYFVNGYLAGSKPLTGLLADSDGRRLALGDQYQTGMGYYTLDDPTYWTNYVLSGSEIMSLRNRTATPGSISPSNIAWAATLDGTPGNPVSLSDPALSNFGYDSSPNLVNLHGSLFYDESLTYTSPITYEYSHIGGSGSTVYFSFTDPNGNDTNVTAIHNHPNISINDGPDIPLENPIWGVSLGNESLPYVLYPIAQTISPSDTVTATAPENWATTVAGSPAGLTDSVLTNKSGSSFLPEFSPGIKPMKVGWNVTPGSYYFAVPLMNNMAKGASPWQPVGSYTAGENGYPAAFNSGTTSLTSVIQLTNASTTYPGSPPGYYRLIWDGSDMAQLEPFDSGTVVSERSRTITGSTNNQIAYTVTKNGSQLYTALQIRILGTDISNIRVYPPEICESVSKFYPNMTNILKGASCIRAMDMMGTNGSNIRTYSDFHNLDSFTYYEDAVLQVPISSITNGPTTGDGLFFQINNHIIVQVTTSVPHNLVSGQTVGFSGVDLLAMSDSTNLNINGFPFFIVHVLNSTQFLFSPFFQGGAATITNTPVSISPGGVVTLNLGKFNMPLEDIVDLVNEVEHCDLWVNIPHCMDDAGVTSMAETIADRLNTDRKVWVEYSNECWNYSTPFTQTKYCYGMGQLDSSINTLTSDVNYRGWMFYAKRAGQCHDLFEATFTDLGRSTSDIIRLLGGQFSSTSLSSVILGYASSHGYDVDAIAIAPYYSNGPDEASLYSIFNSLSIEQLMDTTEAWMMKGTTLKNIEKQMIANPSGIDLVLYEGGPESGLPVIDGHYPINTGSPTPAYRSRAWGRHPRQKGILLHLFQGASDIGVTLFNYFATGGTNGTIDGTNANTKFSSNWNAYCRWDQVPSVGDGTDGLFDNRTSYDDTSQVGCVVGRAVKDWTSRQAGGSGYQTIHLSDGSTVGVKTNF